MNVQSPPAATNTLLNIQDLPDWFDLKNYQHANQLDLEGWIIQLRLRQMIQGFLLRIWLTGIVDDYPLNPENAPSAFKEPITPISIQDALLITEGVKNTVGIPPELWQASSHFDFFEQSADISDAESILSWFHQTDSKKPPSDSYLASHTNSNLFHTKTSQ